MLELKAEPREIQGRKLNSHRKNGKIPAVLYGKGIVPQNLFLDGKEFGRIFKKAGETSLVSLNIGGKNKNVLIRDLDRDVLTDQIIHVDLFEVRMDEKLKAKIPLVFVGESLAVKAENGVLVKNIQEIEVEALPQDLPKEIEIDISKLATFEDKIHVSAIKVSGSAKVLAGPDEIIAAVLAPRSEEELKELDAKPTAEIGEIEVVGEKEKKEAEETVQAEETKGE